jgi:phospholipase/lecithinase/hemolysin
MMTRVAKTLLFALFVLFSFQVPAQGDEYSEVVVFGDSQADQGNLYSLHLAGVVPVPFLDDDPPYFEGRFTDGEVAAERLAARLGVVLEPSLHLLGLQPVGTNFAVAGATAGGDELVDLHAQVNAYRFWTQGVAEQDALYLIIIGGNDIRRTRDLRGPQVYRILQDAAGQVEAVIKSLIGDGAQHFLIVNVPDIGAIPEFQTATLAGLAKQMNLRTRYFNRLLLRSVEDLANGYGDVQLVLFDVFSFTKELQAKAAALGYANWTDACFVQEMESPFDQIYDPDCSPEEFASFLFFDAIHPTAATHRRIASAMEAFVPAP